jgi:hypothetical protein
MILSKPTKSFLFGDAWRSQTVARRMSILRKLSGHSLLQKRLTPNLPAKKDFAKHPSLFSPMMR